MADGRCIELPSGSFLYQRTHTPGERQTASPVYRHSPWPVGRGECRCLMDMVARPIAGFFARPRPLGKADMELASPNFPRLIAQVCSAKRTPSR
jgi:hypothetical protein